MKTQSVMDGSSSVVIYCVFNALFSFKFLLTLNISFYLPCIIYNKTFKYTGK